MEASRTAAGHDRRTRPLVLVVEDNEHDWEIYGKILWYNGFDVVAARDAETALAAGRLRQPDVVLVDIELPGMSGLELCRLFKADPATASAPVVALTAHAAERFAGAARAAGCIAYLEKPVGPIDVLHTVERLVGRPPPPGVARAPELFETAAGQRASD